MKSFKQYAKVGSDLFPSGELILVPELAPGAYSVVETPNGDVYFKEIKINSDEILHLPDSPYEIVVKELEHFLTKEVRSKFEKHGFLYKRSTLLYGPPGSGKTCIVNKVSDEVIKQGGIVLFDPNPRVISKAYSLIDTLQPGIRVLVILEELDELVESYETSLLSILDGEIQRNNVMYLATTNFIERIPGRIRRPGRFSSVVQIGFPSDAARRHYLQKKLKLELKESIIDDWVSKTKNFSIDELKETVVAVLCLGQNLDDVVKRISQNKTKDVYIEELSLRQAKKEMLEIEDDEDKLSKFGFASNLKKKF